jgi:hypothetical protein
MTIQKPEPLPRADGAIPINTPKDALKLMLESSLRHEEGLSTPLDEIDPMALDELINRIDTGALSLNQVPDPQDIEKLVQYYWSLRTKHNLEVQLGVGTTRARKSSGGTPVKRQITPLDLLVEIDEE